MVSRFWGGVALGLGLMASAQAADSDWLAARDAFRKGNVAGLQKARQALGDSPLAAYAEFWQLSMNLRGGKSEGVPEFIAREKGGYLSEKLRMEWMRQLAKGGKWSQFLSDYDGLTEPVDADLQCLKLQAELADGKSPKNLKPLLNKYWFVLKEQPASCTALMDTYLREGLITEDDRWQRARVALEASNWTTAAGLLGKLSVTQSADALKAIGDAPAAFLKEVSLRKRPQRELAAWALGRLARQDGQAALLWLDAHMDDMEEQLPVAWRHMAIAASRRFDVLADNFFRLSSAAWWPETHQEIRLRQLVRQGDWEGYQSRYVDVNDAVKNSRIWRYWHARALRELGSEAAADRVFAQLSTEEDYYGLLSLEALGKVVGAADVDVKLADEDRAALAAHPGFMRALTLFALGQRPEAVLEWNWALRGASDRLLLAAAERAQQVGWYDRSIAAAERTRQLHDIRFRYLSPWREVTRGYSKDLGLDEAWVFGLIRQESRFINTARSSVGAGGLMQLMPGTAQWVANRLGINYHAGIVNEVGQNVRLGTYYLRHIENTLGHPVLATAGYNAGPRRAMEWQVDEPLDATRYIESIPFSETRDYVKKVMTNAVHYARMFGAGETRLLARLGTIPARGGTPIEGP